MLKSAHFHTKSSQICQWKIDFHNPTISKMVQTSPNRSQTSKLIIRNTFWTSKSHIRVTLKKGTQNSPPLKNSPVIKYYHLQWFQELSWHTIYIAVVPYSRLVTQLNTYQKNRSIALRKKLEPGFKEAPIKFSLFEQIETLK